MCGAGEDLPGGPARWPGAGGERRLSWSCWPAGDRAVGDQEHAADPRPGQHTPLYTQARLEFQL